MLGNEKWFIVGQREKLLLLAGFQAGLGNQQANSIFQRIDPKIDPKK
jgi:hypothetical protein